jgi:Flp pilus assembly pilin Flp
MLNLLNSYYARLLALGARREEGQAMAEYAVILAVVAVAVAVTLVLFSNAITSTLNDVIKAL